VSAAPRLVERIAELRALLEAERRAGRRVGFVPTMGALHEGHASLLRRARAECDVTVLSIFVNPLQFGPAEDYAAYPRDLEHDLAVAAREGVDLVFHPSVEEMYPEPTEVRVEVGEIGRVLEGASRPGHFSGVATVVAKLFNIVGPCRAYFGEKDAQQLAVVRRLVRALDLPVEVVGCPTVRDADGLALSSRNAYLGPEERRAATVLKRALDEGARRVAAAEPPAAVARAMAELIRAEPLARLDYAACVDPDTFREAASTDGPVLLAVAAFVGRARLIDNLAIGPAPSPGARTGTSSEASIAKG
jgi:pantoate--beta-alanine ligase